MRTKSFFAILLLAAAALAPAAPAAQADKPSVPNPAIVVWYAHPADEWENALPVGNGRLGAMVFGKTDEEEIQLNEDTLLVGRAVLDHGQGRRRRAARDPAADLRRPAGAGPPPVRPAPHGLPGRAAEVPVARHARPQASPAGRRSPGYRHQLDLDTAVVDDDATSRAASAFSARCSSTPGRPGPGRAPDGRPAGHDLLRRRSCAARATRPTRTTRRTTSRWTASAPTVSSLRGKSADYLGVAGQLRYEARLQASLRGGRDARSSTIDLDRAPGPTT